MVLRSGKEWGKRETATVQYLRRSRDPINFVEFSRHLLHVSSDLLYQFPLSLCDVLISALDATTVKYNRAVNHLCDLYSGKRVSFEGSARDS